MRLQLLKSRFSVCRLDPGAAIPAWASGGGELGSVTRTPDELSVVCPESVVPKDVKCERGWRGFKVEGPLEFSLTGVLVSIAKPLADAGVSIFAVSTYDTDYVLVKEENLDKAIRVLTAAGHGINRR